MTKVKDIILSFRNNLSSQYDKDELEQLIVIAFEDACGFKRHDLVLQYEADLFAQQTHKLENILAGLQVGKPIQYVLGYTWFLNKKFIVSPDVLIPRPETAELVEWILQDQIINREEGLRLIDICTGSAVIPISLALRFPEWEISALDISKPALKIASENVKQHEVTVNLIQADFLNWKSENLISQLISKDKVGFDKFDIIVSNPPYVTNQEKKGMHSRVLDHEPELALFVPDNDPLKFYKELADFSTAYLRPGGKLFLEVSKIHAHETLSLFQTSNFSNVELRKDILDNERMISVTFMPE